MWAVLTLQRQTNQYSAPDRDDLLASWPAGQDERHDMRAVYMDAGD
jgi:hypothetical protein